MNPATRQTGDTDWTSFRPAAQRSSWEGNDYPDSQTLQSSDQSTKKKGLFDFVKGLGTSSSPGTSAQNVDRLAEDIGSGWSSSNTPPSDQYGQDTKGNSYTDDSLDQGWERPNTSYDQADYEPSDDDQSGYDRSGYDQSGYARPAYDPPGYNPAAYSRTEYEKKIYGDDLYGVEDTGYEEESAYEESIVEGPERPEERLDSDGVYEADYRVVLPPSRPLETDEDY